MTYEAFSNKTRSQKFILAHLESKKIFKLFDLYLGNVYSKKVPFFVINAHQDGVELTKRNSTGLLQGEYYYNPNSGVIYIRTTDDSDPKTKKIILTFRHFYSNIPINLPFDLNEGFDVYYDGLIEKIGDLKLELDYENTGIAIESDSSITLVNEGFDEIFDTHIWENQKASFYSWGQELAPSEAKLVYRGFINNKSYSDRSVSFNLRDQLTQLKKIISGSTFSLLDGHVSQEFINKPKRMIFGRAKQIRTTGIDKILTGYSLTGVISGSADLNLLTGTVSALAGTNVINGLGTLFLSQVSIDQRIKIIDGNNEYSFTVSEVTNNTSLKITGTIAVGFNGAEIRNLEIDNNIISGIGTDFRNELSPADSIQVTYLGTQYKFTVKTIQSPTQLIIEDNVEVSFSNLDATVNPNRSYRRKNRKWSVAGHKIYQHETQISEILSQNSIKVNELKDIEKGDYLLIGGLVYVVTRVSFDLIVLNQSLPLTVMVGDSVVKTPVQKAFGNSTEYVVNRDFSVLNSTECQLVFNDLAEFNIAPVKNPTFSMQFTVGSRIITTSASDVDLTTIFQPRDWIRAKRADSPTWYEIQEVSETQAVLVEIYSDVNHTGLIQFKSPEYISDETLVTCDCLGMSKDGEWIRYPAQVVRHVLDDIGIESINEDSFLEAKNDCMVEMSLFYPSSPSGSLPDCRKIITDVNESCFGSLYIDNSFLFKYSILNAEKPEGLTPLKDDDILGFSVSTKNAIVNKVNLLYRPYTDIFSGADVTEEIDLESEFVNNTSATEKTLLVRANVFKEEDAQMIAERWLFFRSLTQSVVTVRANLNLATKSLNDKMFLDLDRIFKRYGGGTKKKIGIINMITKDDSSVQVRFNDLGNLFNRVSTIAPDLQEEYDSATDDEIAKYGFIVDNITETPDGSDNELGNNLIG